jgi:hypothetical protein
MPQEYGILCSYSKAHPARSTTLGICTVLCEVSRQYLPNAVQSCLRGEGDTHVVRMHFSLHVAMQHNPSAGSILQPCSMELHCRQVRCT